MGHGKAWTAQNRGRDHRQRADGVEALDETRARQSGRRLSCTGGAGGCGRHHGQGRRAPPAHHEDDGGQVAGAVQCPPPGGAVRRAAGRRAALGVRRRGRGGDCQNPGDDAEGRDALEHPHHGQGRGHESYDGRPDLAHLWPAAARHRVLQAVARSATGRQSAGRRGAVYAPAAQCGGLLV